MRIRSVDRLLCLIAGPRERVRSGVASSRGPAATADVVVPGTHLADGDAGWISERVELERIMASKACCEEGSASAAPLVLEALRD